MKTLELSPFGSVPVVTFYNESLHKPGVHVFRTAREAEKGAINLRSKDHIHSVNVSDAIVK